MNWSLGLLPNPGLQLFASWGYPRLSLWPLRSLGLRRSCGPSVCNLATAGSCVLSTETRVLTTDAASRRKFRRYWFVFSPGIRLIRHAALNLAKRDLEQPRQAA